MGCGKTTIGRKLAVRLGYRYIDTDYQIEKEEGQRIKDIFATKGEAYFRELETDLLKRLLPVSNTVVATGGGILLTPGNLELVKRIGKTVYLRAGLDDIYERITRNNKRPVVIQNGDLYQTIESMLEKRHVFYEQADYTIETCSLKMWQVVTKIIKDI
jgi:shikimate kinase